MAKLGADARAEHKRQRAEDRRDRRHQDGPQAQEARLIDRLARRQALLPLGLERKVDHHDRVLLDDADEEDDADDPDDVETAPAAFNVRSAPMPADGSVVRIVIGWMKLS